MEHTLVKYVSCFFKVESSPFVERLLKKGYEVLYLVEPVDEYCLSSLPEFEGKVFQNIAKEGFTLPEDQKKTDTLKTKFEALTKWLSETALKDKVSYSCMLHKKKNKRFYHMHIPNNL